jgi:hypothetical protein
MKMEPTEGSETSAISTQTPGKHSKENILHIKHGETLKSRIRIDFRRVYVKTAAVSLVSVVCCLEMHHMLKFYTWWRNLFELLKVASSTVWGNGNGSSWMIVFARSPISAATKILNAWRNEINKSICRPVRKITKRYYWIRYYCPSVRLSLCL